MDFVGLPPAERQHQPDEYTPRHITNKLDEGDGGVRAVPVYLATPLNSGIFRYSKWETTSRINVSLSGILFSIPLHWFSPTTNPMARAYDGNPYASEQGPADEESDQVVNGIESAIELIETAMGDWASVAVSYMPDNMAILHEAREAAEIALEAYRANLTPETEAKPGNECRFCSNWVDVERGFDTCTDCLKKQ